MHPYICGARGFTPYKPASDGRARPVDLEFRPDVDRCRPIAAGDFILRVASTIGCELDKESMVNHLSPLQLGVGVPGGAEAVSWIFVITCKRGQPLL